MANNKMIQVIDEFETISKIADRAVQMNPQLDWGGIVDDVTDVHFNCVPLALNALLTADQSVFSADIYGIAANLDRRKTKLLNGYTPFHALSHYNA